MAKNDRKPEAGDNSKAREADLLALMADLRPARDAVELAQATVKKAKDHEQVVKNRASQLGFSIAILEEALKREREPTNRRGHAALEEERYFIFKTLGLPVPAMQGELDLGSEEDRNEAYWADQGYQAGIRGDAAKAPDLCPPHRHQTWLTRRADGAAYSAWGKAEAGGKPDQGKASTTVDDVDQARADRDGSLREPTDDEIRNPDKEEPEGEVIKDPLLA